MTHAKAIFFGEHAVVYGHEGITIPLPEMKIDVTLENTNEIQHRDDISQIPVKLIKKLKLILIVPFQLEED